MTRTISSIALTLALAASFASPPAMADQTSTGSGTGLGAPQSKITRAMCLNSFREDLALCGSAFPNDDILREACAAGVLEILEACLDSI